jgi:hypothetical protein
MYWVAGSTGTRLLSIETDIAESPKETYLDNWSLLTNEAFPNDRRAE